MGGRTDCFSSRIGTSFEAKRWLSMDPCGLLGISCSFFVHVFAFAVSSTLLIEDSLFSTAVFLLLYTPATILALTSLFMAWTTNPGAVPMGARPLVTVKRAASGELSPVPDSQRRRGLRRCPKCNDNYKAPRAHHDSVTGRCIVKFDHFCPWVGNAVGAMNHKFFVLFIFYTVCSCILCLFLMLARMIQCGSHGSYYNSSSKADGISSEEESLVEALNRTAPSIEDQTRLFRYLVMDKACTSWNESMFVLILFVVTVVFLVFTLVMLFDQKAAIETNASKIARMKMRVGQGGTELSRVTEEFNEMFGGNDNNVTWHWFLPLPVEFPRGMEKIVLGYEWDETFDPVPYDDGSSAASAEEDGRAKIELTPQNRNLSMNGNIGLTVNAAPQSPQSIGPLSSSSTRRNDLETGRNNLKPAPLSTLSTSRGVAGEEDAFTGATVMVNDGQPVVPKKQLTKRSNSRGRLEVAAGHLS